jgi:hypothetical protein
MSLLESSGFPVCRHFPIMNSPRVALFKKSLVKIAKQKNAFFCLACAAAGGVNPFGFYSVYFRK